MMHLGVDFFVVVYFMGYFNIETFVCLSLKTFISIVYLVIFFYFLCSLFLDLLLVGCCNAKISPLFLLFFAQNFYPFIFLF